jgi:hypothetical protein
MRHLYRRGREPSSASDPPCVSRLRRTTRGLRRVGSEPERRAGFRAVMDGALVSWLTVALVAFVPSAVPDLINSL